MKEQELTELRRKAVISLKLKQDRFYSADEVVREMVRLESGECDSLDLFAKWKPTLDTQPLQNHDNTGLNRW